MLLRETFKNIIHDIYATERNILKYKLYLKSLNLKSKILTTVIYFNKLHFYFSKTFAGSFTGVLLLLY